jgi:hypothetical protein
MPFVPDVLQALDLTRAIGGVLGLRVFQVKVRRRTWSGSRPGLPGTTKVDVDVVLTNLGADGVSYPVRVRQISRTEAVSSGGQYTNRDLKVGPMSPVFAASAFGPSGGFDDATFDPEPNGQAVQLIWSVSTPNGTFGIPENGTVFEKRGEEATALHYYVILRQSGRVPT